jgi:outer membrane receptor for ferrienterochelin and colicins
MNKKFIIAMLLLCIAASGVYADDKQIMPIDTISLKEMVVTATRNPTTKWLAPALVNVLPHKIFENVEASCLAQGLSYIPGVRVEVNCQNCGWTQARINGLDGHYSQILIDSRPMFSALTNIYGLEQLPANMIDHVEVMRGGGSALFGSSSIGGTINVITREPLSNSASLQHSLISIGNNGTFENNTTMNSSVVTSNRQIGLYIYGSNRIRQPYDADDDGFSELNKIQTKSIGARAVMKPSGHFKISLDYHSIDDSRRGGNEINLPPHDADLAETTSHTINGGGINVDMFSREYVDKFNTYFSFQHTDRNSYYGADHSTKNYGLTKDMTYVAGMQYTHDFASLIFLPANFTLGAEYNSDKIKDESIGYKVFVNQHARIGSFFLQNEWKNDNWSLLIGGRLDKHNMIEHVIFSPRLNVRYSPNDSWNFRATMSGGFRAPQAYDEDLHVDLVNGNRRVVRLADNLKEEKSISWSSSVNYHHHLGKVIADILMEAFYTDLRNSFAFRQLDEKTSDGAEIDERYNASGARVYGMNFEVQSSFASLMDLQFGLTCQKSKYKAVQQWSDDESVPYEKRMFRTPDVYGYLTADINPWKNFVGSLTCNYTGKMLVQHCVGSGVEKDVAVNTPAFFETNLKLAYNIPLFNRSINLQLNGGVLNIFNSYQKDFDKGKDRDSGYIYGPLMPRSCFLGISLSLL